MKTWNRLFIRHGILLKEVRGNVFDCSLESEENMSFLFETLDRLVIQYNYSLEVNTLSMLSGAVSEDEWFEVVDFWHRGVTEELWPVTKTEQPILRKLDTHISGIIRQLNRLGLYTTNSCEGTIQRVPIIGFQNKNDMDLVAKVLKAINVKGNDLRVTYSTLFLRVPRAELLPMAEKLNVIQPEWLTEDTEYIKKQLFYHQLEQLLSIDGESGDEGNIREFVSEKLAPLVDKLTVDRNGNILAQKTYKSGTGPTILLNAHLDTVYGFEPGKTIVKDGPIWSSSEGILGADDRAGIAVLLEVAENLRHSNFNGTVKYVFTVEEEIGLVGARNVDEYFLWDVDAAIVVDRRGKGDIVTSCGEYIKFCNELYGKFFESVAVSEGLEGWKCTTGGSSDTRIWASHGIQSVNLSAGYQNEHTDEEEVDVEACYETFRLISGVFEQTRELVKCLRQIKRNNQINSPNQAS
ncbi:M20/M25/M40 family metallo-hydrolase [Alkalihalobacillus sp. R86527]|uniref:M20/M25/M40 family metallo-hydrolase n=1 Tax=Alkalihalobacillus sp. R86527 TaxID=3093863 RepID=UPI00366E3ABC